MSISLSPEALDVALTKAAKEDGICPACQTPTMKFKEVREATGLKNFQCSTCRFETTE